MIILSIDSGVEKTGFAVFDNGVYRCSALIETSKKDLPEKRLEKLYNVFLEVFDKHKPGIVVVERLFFFNNQKTMVSVSQSQGIVMLIAAKNNIKVEFLTPTQIKQTVTGYGKSDKKSVQKMLKIELGIDVCQDDEADAIACGYAYYCLKKSIGA